jgi:hypothetical protein
VYILWAFVSPWRLHDLSRQHFPQAPLLQPFADAFSHQRHSSSVLTALAFEFLDFFEVFGLLCLGFGFGLAMLP